MSIQRGETLLETVRQRSRQFGRVLFGDTAGLVLFLLTVVAVGLIWRAGTFITDTHTLIRTLEAVSNGQLHIDTVSEGHFSAPGAVVADGIVYGRGYGHTVLSLPFLWLLEGVSMVANLRMALVAGWHLALLFLVMGIGRLLDAERVASIGGSVLVLASFLLNMVMVSTFAAANRYLLALQLGTILTAGLLSVLTYRFVRYTLDLRRGLFAGYAVVLVLPVGFWAQIPKRHVLVATILLGMLYAFARSRSVDGHVQVGTVGSLPVYRMGAYAMVGLLAWINAAEAIFVLAALLLIDLPTAPSNDPRTLGVLVLILLLSLVPFFLTNWLITGDVLRPPLTLTPADRASPQPADVLFGGSGEESTGGQSPGGSSGGQSVPGAVAVEKFLWLASLIGAQVAGSLERLSDGTSVVKTWIRSGSLEGVATRGVAEFRASNLTVLESMPLLGTLVAVVGAGVRRRGSVIRRLSSVDAFVVALVVTFVLLYMQALPNHAQITVRYLVPVYPAFLYLILRQRSVVAVLREQAGTIVWTYSAIVLIGSQLFIVSVVAAGMSVSEAMQMHALLGLAAALFVAVCVAASEVVDGLRSMTAIAIGIAAAMGSVFIVMTGVAHFSFIGEYVLPISQFVGDLIAKG